MTKPTLDLKLKEISSRNEIFGKTIKNIAFSEWIGQAVICFDDDTFITLDIDESWREPKIIFGTLDIDTFGDDRLAQAGVIDRDDAIAYRERLRDEAEARNKAAEYARYQLLKARFEREGEPEKL